MDFAGASWPSEVDQPLEFWFPGMTAEEEFEGVVRLLLVMFKR